MSAQDKDAAAPTAAPAAEAPQASAAPGRGGLAADSADGLVGNGLPYKQKSLFQASLGTDLSNVRVRTDAAAAKLAEQHNARAFAVGEEINFAAGQYQPDTPKGDRLLAHEVAHTVQQRDAAKGEQNPGAELKTTTPGDSAEKGADTAAAAMVQGKAASVESTDLAIAKKGMDEDVAPPAEEGGPAPASGDQNADPNGPAKAADGKEGELEGDLEVERTGTEEVEGNEPVGPPQNLEGGKQEIAAKAKDLPPDGGAEELKAGGPQVEGGGGGGGGGDVQLTEDVQLAIEVAQADAKEGAAEAKAEADAYKAAMGAERDRFDAQQEALTLEQLKAMAPADKRSTLIEMGYDEKSVKKMKDAELDGVISGKLAAENRKTRILGMEPDELRALSPDRKMQFLVDLGVDRGDLQKIGMAKTTAAFDQVMAKAHVPGQHKVKIKIKGGFIGIGKKEWEIKLDVDGEGNPEFDVQKKGGWLSKLWGWVKAALPIIALVLAPITGGASLVALAVYQTVTAIAAGDWLGAIIGVAGAVVGLGAIKAISGSASNAANAFKKVADVAGKVKNVAIAAKASMMAVKAKSPGGLLAALATGASAFADFAAKSAENFAKTMKSWAEKLEKWSRVISGGEQVVQGIKSGDPAAAVAGAFEGAAAAVSKPQKQADGTTKETSKTATNLEKYSRIATYASMGQRAAKGQPPDYGGVVDAAMSIAGEFKTGGSFEKAQKITSAASRLTRAIQTKNPGEIAAAMLGVAESIQLAKIGSDPEEDSKDGKTPDEQKAEITKRYSKAAAVVRSASAALTAAAQKPRPNYPAALEASMQLIADLTESKKMDQVAVLTKTFDAWTAAVRSKNEQAILDAGIMFGTAINDMRDIIHAERDAAKKAAQAQRAPDDQEPEGDDGGLLPSIPLTPLAQLPGTVIPMWSYPEPLLDSEGNPIAIDATEPAKTEGPTAPNRPSPRSNTPGGNYTVVSGDTLSGLSKLFNVTIAQLRNVNPQLDGDKIFVGQRLSIPGMSDDVVVVRPGTPGPTTGAPGQTPGSPTLPGNGLPTPDRAPESADVGKAISLAMKFGELTEWPAPFNSFLSAVKSAVDTRKKLAEENKTATDAYKDALSALETFAKSTQWADAVIKKVAGYSGEFRGMIDIDGDAQAVRVLTQYARVGKWAARGANLIVISEDFFRTADEFVRMMGVDPDSGRSLSMLERAEAANRLIRGTVGLYGELKWMGDVAKAIGPKLVETLSSILSRVSGAVSRVSGRLTGPLMDRIFRPMLEKVAREKGVAEAGKLATQLMDDVGRWAATHWAKSQASRAAFSIATKALAGSIASSVGILVGPLYWVYEYYKFLHDELPGWYFDAKSGMSTLQTPEIYGMVIHDFKDSIRRQVINTAAQGQAAIRFLYSLFGGVPDQKLRAGWPEFAKQHLFANTGHGPNAKHWHNYAGSAEQLIPTLDEYSTAHVARYLQGGALVYADQRYQEIFGIPPPASS